MAVIDMRLRVAFPNWDLLSFEQRRYLIVITHRIETGEARWLSDEQLHPMSGKEASGS